MSKIRSRGNRDTELLFASLLRKNKIFGWRRHLPIIGRPDFAFRRDRLAVFIDGCFWHRCPKCSNMPANNREFWKRKLNANKRRDKEVNLLLSENGWRVLRFWEHELRNTEAVAKRLLAALAR
jgi:DNA mismatch endonuclease (patch repair protein)